MSGALEVAAVGMQAQQRALDTIANNISNINTPTFKRSELRFSALVGTGAEAAAASLENLARDEALAGVGWESRPLVDRQGQLDATGNSRDLAIDGTGFIEVLGPAGRTLLWRGGTLRVLDDGTLASAAGYPLKAGINVPSDATAFRIERGGKVFVTTRTAPTDSEIGQINLVKVADAVLIERLDGGVFAVADEAGALEEAGPGEEGLGALVQGSIERSNVDLNTEMVSLLVSQRAYAANAQVIRAADELYAIANGLRR